MAPSRTAQQQKTVTIYPYDPASARDSLHAFKESAVKDSSDWNSLLRWHRRNRGPQWDFSTAMYHVDQGSKEYYAGVQPVYDPSNEAGLEGDSPERASQAEKQSEEPQPDRRQSQNTTPQTYAGSLPPMPAPLSEPRSESQPAALQGSPMQQSPQRHAQPQQQQQQYIPQQGSPPAGLPYYPGQSIPPQAIFRQGQLS